jgi:hypothetical protein
MPNNWATATPFEISSYDNPETIRFRKYARGTHLVMHGLRVEAGLTPRRQYGRGARPNILKGPAWGEPPVARYRKHE